MSFSLTASANVIALALAQATHAAYCCLAFIDDADQRLRVLAISAGTQLTPAQHSEIMLFLWRTYGRIEPVYTTVLGAAALALPLHHQGKPLGAALLCYDGVTPMDMAQAQAAASLSAMALGAAVQVAALQSQAVEVEQQARLREIQVSRNLIRGVIDGIPLGLALLNAEGTLLAVNRAISDRFGCDPMLLVGTHYNTSIGHWEESPAARTFTTGAVERLQRALTQPDGTTALLEIASFPLLDTGGLPYQVIEVWDDITQRVALQTQLVRAEKLAAIGQLAASIAHEVGNPLQAIQGFLSLFLEQCPPTTHNRHFLELAEGEIDRIVHVIARLRDLYRPTVDVSGLIDLNELIEHVLLLTSKQLERRNIRVIYELQPMLPRTYAIANQIKQVLLNLVLNATEAMSAGGVLHIQTATHTTRADGAMIMVALKDTGVGIPPEQLVHIFDGLHTTKERGMGLGLYTSKAIIEQHMGRIAVQSTVGQGTIFTILLPIRS